MFSKCSIHRLFELLAVIVICGCSRHTTGPDQEGTKQISIPASMYYFVPDSVSFRFVALGRYTGEKAGNNLQKNLLSTVKIEPQSVEVMVTWYDETFSNALHGAEDQISPVYEYYDLFWNEHEWQYNRWDYQVDYYRNHPVEKLLSHGVLQRSGDYASGTVNVKKGLNNILIGFVMPGDTVYGEYFASYRWGIEGFEDGWYQYDLTGTEVLVDTLRFN